jgi:hypothetical protein
MLCTTDPQPMTLAHNYVQGYLADGGFKKQDPKTHTILEIIERII